MGSCTSTKAINNSNNNNKHDDIVYNEYISKYIIDEEINKINNINIQLDNNNNNNNEHDEKDEEYIGYVYDISNNNNNNNNDKNYIEYKYNEIINNQSSNNNDNNENKVTDKEYESARNAYINIDQFDVEYDWNDYFQHVIDRNIATPQDHRDRINDITYVTERFKDHVSIVAKAIIMNQIFPNRESIVKPVNVGGQAGGEKYIVGNVLYKFATDWMGIYGGNDLYAEKAAKLEVQATSALINEDVRLIHSTLVCLFRYRGYCVYAIALIPLDKDKNKRKKTLVYGSKDAGKNVEDASNLPGINGLMKEVANKFHLRLHRVKKTNKVLCHPVDVECHIGNDGRLYLFDLARESPPTPPLSNVKNSYLIYHFRFELLKLARQVGLPSLSSDAYSNFTTSDEYIIDERDINIVFKYLHNEMIPKLAIELDQIELYDNNKFDLSRIFHKYGVNMRYISSVAKHCKNKEIRQYLCEEMYIRVMKTSIRAIWNKSITCSEEYLLNCTRLLINEIFSNDEWSLELVNNVKDKYCEISNDIIELNEDLNKIACGEHSWCMIVRLLDGLGIDYDSKLSLNNKKEFMIHSDTWKMSPVLVTIKAPEFADLNSREEEFKNEIKLREESKLSIIPPLRKLLKLYKVWSKEEAKVTKSLGIEVVNRLLNIINESASNNNEKKNDNDVLIRDQMAWVIFNVASFYYHFGYYNESAIHYEDCVKIFRSLYGDEHSSVATTLSNMGNLYRAQGKLKEALEYLKESLNMRKSLLGNEHSSVADTLNNMGLVFKDQDELDKALEYYEESLNISKKLYGDKHIRVAGTLMNMAAVFLVQDELDKALEYFEQSLNIYKKLLGDEHTSVAGTLSNMGNVFQKKDELDKALEYYEESLNIYKKTVGNEHTSVADVLNNMGLVFRAKGDLDKALEYYEESLNINKKAFGNEHARVALSLINMGFVFKEQDELSKALETFEQSLNIKKKLLGNEHTSVGTTLSYMAIVFQAQGKLDKALDYCEQSLNIFKKLLGNEHTSVANILNIIGVVYYTQDNLDKALEYYEESLNIKKKVLGNEHTSIADTLNNMATVFQAQGKLDKALDYCEQSLNIYKKIFGDNHISVANPLMNMGNAFRAQSELEKALEYYEESLNIKKKLLGDEHTSVADILNNMGIVFKEQDKLDKALEHFEESLNIYKKLLGDNHINVGRTLGNMGLIYIQKNSYKEAQTLLMEAMRIYSNSLPPTHSYVILAKDGLTQILINEWASKYIDELPSNNHSDDHLFARIDPYENVIVANCDKCHQDINGFQYKCRMCDQYDICDNCQKEMNNFKYDILSNDEKDLLTSRINEILNFNPIIIEEKGYAIYYAIRTVLYGKKT